MGGADTIVLAAAEAAGSAVAAIETSVPLPALGAAALTTALGAAAGRSASEQGHRERLRQLREEVKALQGLQEQELAVLQAQMWQRTQVGAAARVRVCASVARGGLARGAGSVWADRRCGAQVVGLGAGRGPARLPPQASCWPNTASMRTSPATPRRVSYAAGV